MGQIVGEHEGGVGMSEKVLEGTLDDMHEAFARMRKACEYWEREALAARAERDKAVADFDELGRSAQRIRDEASATLRRDLAERARHIAAHREAANHHETATTWRMIAHWIDGVSTTDKIATVHVSGPPMMSDESDRWIRDIGWESSWLDVTTDPAEAPADCRPYDRDTVERLAREMECMGATTGAIWLRQQLREE